jgi:hypothetical protein
VILTLGCVPPIRPLFVRLFRSVSSSIVTNYGHSPYGTNLHYGPRSRIVTKDHIGLNSLGGSRGEEVDMGVRNEICARKDDDNASWQNIVPKYNEVIVTTNINVDKETRDSISENTLGNRSEKMAEP